MDLIVLFLRWLGGWGGDDVCDAVLEFMETGKLLKELNCTNLVLLPKVEAPVSVLDFRPIACCNTLYKVITKMLCSRMKRVLPDIISPNQSGFIQGRRIVHNICVIQDIGFFQRSEGVEARRSYVSLIVCHVHGVFVKGSWKSW